MTEFSTTAIGSNNKGFDRELISEGLHAAKCIGVYGIGTHLNSYGNEQEQIVLTWAVGETYVNDKKEENYKKISRKYTLSLNVKANLRKDLKKWRGKDFSEEELEGFDVSKILGTTCLLNIIHFDIDGIKKDRVESVTKMDKKFINDIPKISVIEDAPEWIEKLRSESLKKNGKSTQSQEPTKIEEASQEEYSDDIPF